MPWDSNSSSCTKESTKQRTIPHTPPGESRLNVALLHQCVCTHICVGLPYSSSWSDEFSQYFSGFSFRLHTHSTFVSWQKKQKAVTSVAFFFLSLSLSPHISAVDPSLQNRVWHPFFLHPWPIIRCRSECLGVIWEIRTCIYSLWAGQKVNQNQRVRRVKAVIKTEMLIFRCCFFSGFLSFFFFFLIEWLDPCGCRESSTAQLRAMCPFESDEWVSSS